MALLLAGYFLGGVDFVATHVELMTLGIVALSLVPVIVPVLRHRLAGPSRETDLVSDDIGR